MVKIKTTKNQKVLIFLSLLLILSASIIFNAYSDVTFNILAVNGTDNSKVKEVEHYLPSELKFEDILDTNGLTAEYEVVKGAYKVSGTVTLGPKETKTFKIRIRDVWVIDEDVINELKKQIEINYTKVKSGKFSEIASKKREYLIGRLDYVLEQQARYADDAEKRIDVYRIYSKEIDDVKKNALSYYFWRTDFVPKDQGDIVKFVVEVNNPSEDSNLKVSTKHYLPKEVLPEHFLDLQGFNLRYDLGSGQTYLLKEEELAPKENKRYEFTLQDVWRIQQKEIDILKDRTVKAFKLLKNTEYVESAKYLVANIKKNLSEIEESQAEEKEIKEHISSFRINSKKFDEAKKDVETLENLLTAVREELERSQLKNVLQKLKSLNTIAMLAKSLFSKPTISTAWKIIIGVITFVGLITLVHYFVWKKRSLSIKTNKSDDKS